MFKLTLNKKREEYLPHFAWGLKNFVLKESCDPPSNVRQYNLFTKTKNTDSFFKDIHWALSHGKNFQPSKTSAITEKVLGTKRVCKIIEEMGAQGEQKAREICKTMFATYDMKLVRFFAWSLHKAFQKIYEKVTNFYKKKYNIDLDCDK